MIFGRGALDFCQTVEISLQHIALEYEGGELPFADDLDESCGLEFFHVVRERRGADGLALAKITAGDAAFLAYLFEDLVAARIGQRSGDEPNLLFT